MTTDAKCNQVVHRVAAESTPGFQMMDSPSRHRSLGGSVLREIRLRVRPSSRSFGL
jgi:hypothetical protein